MIKIQIPPHYEPERRYIISVIFEEFLGLEIQVQVVVRLDVRVTIDDDRELIIADGLFSVATDQWLQPTSLPKQPLKVWNLATTGLTTTTIESQIPVIYGNDPDDPNFFQASGQQIYLGLDILGSAFFMLTRYEEVVKTDRDQHDRFPAKASLAYQEGFLDRPIINEYLEILWCCLKHLWFKLERKPRQFQLRLSHDVDNPFELTPFSIKRWSRRMIGDIIVRRNPLLAVSLAINGCRAVLNLPYQDRLDTFDWLMDQSEAIGVRSAFYFICGYSPSDPRYDVNEPAIRRLIRRILTRGHEVGLHPSYDTYLQPDKLMAEVMSLQKILAEEGVSETQLGGRQHYLRWKAPDTWQHWEDAGLAYDTSLTFADRAGFRCGSCYEYPVFNLQTRQALRLRERPLIAMECSLLNSAYMNLSCNDATEKIKKLFKSCKIFSGELTLLWHNSDLITAKTKDLYTKYIVYVNL